MQPTDAGRGRGAPNVAGHGSGNGLGGPATGVPARGGTVPEAAAGGSLPGAFTPGTLLVRNREVPTQIGELRQADLHFFVENPRVYSLLHQDGQPPPQDEIERTLQGMDHVKELVHQIRDNGGLVDPLVVRGGTLDVIEGNSRLAAYRLLAKTHPIKWAHVRCTVLPADVDDSVIAALLGQWHLKGKKEWLPFEQAGYLYRRHTVQGVAVDALAAEVGLGQPTVQRLVDTYAFMVAHNDRTRDRWSYYDELTKSRKIAKVRERHADFDDLVVGMIQSGEIARAQDVRDKLPVICESKPKLLQKFLTGTSSFEEAYERAVDAGGDDGTFQRLAKFRKWLAQADVQDALAASDGTLRKQVEFELKQMQRLLASVAKKVAS